MKKRLAFIFLGILLLLGVIYLLRYKRALVFEDKIPKSATEVIHVNLRQIEHHILADAIKNPLKYIDFKLLEKKKDSLKLKKIISIPRNIFFYTNDAQFMGVWISSFIEVKKHQKLSNYLIRDGFVKSYDEDVILFSKKSLVIAVKNERLVVVFKKDEKTTISAITNEIFEGNIFLSKTSAILRAIVISKSDISYATVTDDFVEANFKNGLFEVLGTLNSDLFLSSSQPDYSKNSLGYINTKINKEHQLFKTLITGENSNKFNDFTKLSIDSITSKWNGSVAFKLESINNKTDTIVTYDYDDDFNKTEKVAIQELAVPELNFKLGSEASLFDYLSNKKAIQIIGGETLFTSIPLYKMYANSTATTLNIGTRKDFLGVALMGNKVKLNAYFNIEKYLQKPLESSYFPNNNSYLQLLKDASVMYAIENKLSITLTLKDSERNFIGQFVKP